MRWEGGPWQSLLRLHLPPSPSPQPDPEPSGRPVLIGGMVLDVMANPSGGAPLLRGSTVPGKVRLADVTADVIADVTADVIGDIIAPRHSSDAGAVCERGRRSQRGGMHGDAWIASVAHQCGGEGPRRSRPET